MEAETDPAGNRVISEKNGNKKRQISVRENWRAKNSHYYTEIHGTIMPMQYYTCPEEAGGRNVWFQPPRHLKRKSSLLNSNGFVFGVLIPKNQKERADNRENISSIIGSASLRLALSK